MTDYSELKRLALAAWPDGYVVEKDTDIVFRKGQEPSAPTTYVRNEEDEAYLATLEQKYIAAASPDVVLALIAENENFRRILDRAVFVDAPSQDAAEVTQ